MGYLDNEGLAHFWGNVKGYVDARSARVPVGTIVIWSGAADNIPTGWHLCDGTNGTPDLRGRFVLGAGGAYDVGTADGEETHKLTVNEMPKHQHNYHFTMDGQEELFRYIGTKKGQTTLGELYSNFTGGDQPHNNMPPYYALCYIMKLTADETDASGGGTSQEVYSTEEQLIGTWIDGKALYRRTFLGNTPNNRTNGVLTVDLSKSGIGYIVMYDGKIHNDQNGFALELNYCNGSNPAEASFFTQVNPQGVYMTCMQDSVLKLPFYITIAYTKTTNTATTQLDDQPLQALAAQKAPAAMPVTGAYNEEV